MYMLEDIYKEEKFPNHENQNLSLVNVDLQVNCYGTSIHMNRQFYAIIWEQIKKCGYFE